MGQVVEVKEEMWLVWQVVVKEEVWQLAEDETWLVGWLLSPPWPEPR